MSYQDRSGQVPAGWYPDPEGNPCQRFWSGTQWSEQTRPLTTPVTTGPTAPIEVRLVSPPRTPRTGANGLAIASFVIALAAAVPIFLFPLGLLGFLGGSAAIVAVVFGHVGLKQIKESAGMQGGRGLAIAGLVIGYVGLAWMLLSVVLLIFL